MSLASWWRSYWPQTQLVHDIKQVQENWDEPEPEEELDRKAVIYSDLEGLERGEAIRLLNEIILEQLSQDPGLSVETVKKATPGFQNAMVNLSWQNVAFLCSQAIDFYIRTSIFDKKAK